MGSCKSKAYYQGETLGYSEIIELQTKLDMETTIPLELQVAHYTPSTFPMDPVVNKQVYSLCDSSWKMILDAVVFDEEGRETGMSGVTAFYNEFYQRLDLVDSNGHFEAILSRHSAGDEQSKIAAKGAILIRIVKFAFAVAKNPDKSQMKLYMLGKAHISKGIRPWQYSVFIQILLQTISARLDAKATNDIMEAWVNLFALILRSLLPPAIAGQVIETEINVNTSSEFSGGRVLDEVAELEEVKGLKKKMERNSQAGSMAGSVKSSMSSLY